MKKLLIILLLCSFLQINADCDKDNIHLNCIDEQFRGPLESLHDDLKTRIVGLKRLGLFFCLYTFDKQNSYLREKLGDYIALSIDAGFVIDGEKLQEYIKNNVELTPSYKKHDLKGENPSFTNACLNLYDSKEYIQKIHNLLNPNFTKNTTYTQKYKEIYNSVMSKYCKECRI